MAPGEIERDGRAERRESLRRRRDTGRRTVEGDGADHRRGVAGERQHQRRRETDAEHIDPLDPDCAEHLHQRPGMVVERAAVDRIGLAITGQFGNDRRAARGVLPQSRVERGRGLENQQWPRARCCLAPAMDQHLPVGEVDIGRAVARCRDGGRTLSRRGRTLRERRAQPGEPFAPVGREPLDAHRRAAIGRQLIERNVEDIVGLGGDDHRRGDAAQRRPRIIAHRASIGVGIGRPGREEIEREVGDPFGRLNGGRQAKLGPGLEPREPA